MRSKRFFYCVNRILIIISEFSKLLLFFPLAQIKYRGRKIIIVSERGTDARDNGYHLYKYIRYHYPKEEAYYIIDKRSEDYKVVAGLGNVVDYRSLSHYLLFFASNIRISTHVLGFAPEPWFYHKVFSLFQSKNKVNVFLQHGIIKDDIETLHKEYSNINLFITGAKPEYDFVRETFGYPPSQVIYTGLARFDSLKDYSVKRQILVMPTWRKNLSGMTSKEFVESEYFKTWQEFVNDASIDSILKENGFKMIFYPHYEIQKYIDYFSTSSSAVIIASKKEYDVQTLLKESALLITDFSSVYFDFAYMNKPCIYYQFDVDDYRKMHYAKGYFVYDTMGFGPVCINREDVVFEMQKCINRRFVLEKIYRERIDGFFVLNDSNNCKRIMDAIFEKANQGDKDAIPSK